MDNYATHKTPEVRASLQPLMKARILVLRSLTEVKTPRRMAARSMTEKKISTMLSQEALGGGLVMDNYATHKTPEVRAWLEANPRVHVHFTPTSASWLNMVEIFF